MKRIVPYVTLFTVLFLCGMPSGAQNKNNRRFMEYQVFDGDTVFYDVLKPAKVWQRMPKQKGREWRKYYKLVHNFSKTYPYALLAREIVHQTDSIIAAEGFSRRQEDKFVNALQKQLFSKYEKPMRNMTISQGQLLMKLIDREIGQSSYDIIKVYKNKMAAGFWQGVAKLFGSDLKSTYDPNGEDAPIEDLVQKWEDGDFPGFYWSIFGKYPTVPVLQ